MKPYQKPKKEAIEKNMEEKTDEQNDEQPLMIIMKMYISKCVVNKSTVHTCVICDDQEPMHCTAGEKKMMTDLT